MKKAKIGAGLSACGKRLGKLVAVAAAIFAGSTALPAAEKEDSLPGLGVQPTEYFYTGKPYDSDTESYTFRYRNYDPELNRWTTMDPSGFPDGANNIAYLAIPTSEFDWAGTIVIHFGTATGSMVYQLTWQEQYVRVATSFPPQVSYNWEMTTVQPNSTQTVNDPITAPTGLDNFQWTTNVLTTTTYTPTQYADTGWTWTEGSTRDASSTKTESLSQEYSYTTLE
ncbi:MAG: RHS repeat-associated core domain-containing protein [Terrimicrobiaceae bacterium]|nr:hypothetical protein [Terrimicrobiaceae bacterium]